jgi:NTE family protein
MAPFPEPGTISFDAGPSRTTALVLAGGIALGAYEAGAYAALQEAGGPLPDWLVGTSIGAVIAAILAGNPPERRVEQLRRFWDAIASDPMPATSFWFGPPPATGAWRRATNRASALQSLSFGRPGLFRPAVAGSPLSDVPALYDLQPLREHLSKLVDFDRLNGPEAPRLSIAATDLLTGGRIVFDTRHGARIGPEHLVGSCALVPFFVPIEVDGHLLGDGGLTGNTPLDLVLDEPGTGDLVCFAVDLFNCEGNRPRSLSATAERAMAISFGHQTHTILQAREREHHLRALIRRLGKQLPSELHDDAEIAPLLAEADRGTRAATVLLLTYRALAEDVAFAAAFDFSAKTISERWQTGSRNMRKALQVLAASLDGQTEDIRADLVVHRIPD